jgi:hypothetical protein
MNVNPLLQAKEKTSEYIIELQSILYGKGVQISINSERRYTALRDSQKLVLKHYQEMGLMINNACYSVMLHDRLKAVTLSEHQGQLSKAKVNIM